EEGVEDLDGDVAVEGGLVGLIDLGHAAAPDPFEDAVAPQGAPGQIAHGNVLRCETWPKGSRRAGSQAGQRAGSPTRAMPAGQSPSGVSGRLRAALFYHSRAPGGNGRLARAKPLIRAPLGVVATGRSLLPAL